MSTNTDPNGDRRPGEPFVYKRSRAKLDPVEIDPARFLAMGVKNLTHEEAAAILGVHRSTFEDFLAANEEHKDAFIRGKQLRKVRLREILDIHSRSDPATAWRLAKNELGLSDDPTKAKLDEAQTRILKRMDREEALGRIAELQKRLGIVGVVENVEEERPTTTRALVIAPDAPAKPAPARPKAGRIVLNDGFEDAEEVKPSRYVRRAAELGYDEDAQAPAGQEVQAAADHEPAHRAGDDPVDAAQDRRGRAAKGATDGKGEEQGRQRGPDAAEGRGEAVREGAAAERAKTIETLQARLAELEASAVRKHPRKDGKPHTDRTKQPATVAPKANSGQVRSYAPPRR
jgi:predicted DNA-binding protein (UPF0251 family)